MNSPAKAVIRHYISRRILRDNLAKKLRGIASRNPLSKDEYYVYVLSHKSGVPSILWKIEHLRGEKNAPERFLTTTQLGCGMLYAILTGVSTHFNVRTKAGYFSFKLQDDSLLLDECKHKIRTSDSRGRPKKSAS